MIHCPTCDAGLRFDIETQKMACDHCGNLFEVDAVNDSTKFDAKGHRMLDLYIFACPDCGAELAVNDANDAVGFCPYCGGSSMLFDRVRQDWVPDSAIPFKVTKDQCKQAYVDEVRKHRFVSRKYCDPDLIESFRGIYMPYWSFECKQDEPFKIQGTDVVDGEESGTKVKRTYEQWYESDYMITGCAHDASSGFDDHTSEHLAPYDESEAREFHPGYLSGFYAEIGDMDHETYARYVTERCQDYVAEQLPQKMTREERRDIPTKITSLANVLYPVWFMSYRRGDKISYAAVNGQTGKVSADLPLSPARILVAAVAAAAAVFAVLFLFMGVLPSVKASDMLALSAVIAFASACFLNKSCLGTLSESLRLDEPPPSENTEKTSGPTLYLSSTAIAVVASFVAVFGYFLGATDGSYKGSARTFGFTLFIAGCVFLASWAYRHFKYEAANQDALKANKASQLENGVVETYFHYKTVFNVLKVVICVSCFLGIMLGWSGAADKMFAYVLCFVLGAEIVAYAAVQIAFQTKIAERRPPQMSKKGAYYDAN